jgi:DNA-directed RNA polymerase specialized sigma24 family protein
MDVVQGHHLELTRLALLVVGDLATAEDVVQDTFEQLHRRWHLLRRRESALDYARSAVLNRCRSVHRRRGVARRYERQLAGEQDTGDVSESAVRATASPGPHPEGGDMTGISSSMTSSGAGSPTPSTSCTPCWCRRPDSLASRYS